MTSRTKASFFINGEPVEYESNPEKTLLEYLRESGLVGTKLACGEGGCGACTVVVSRKRGETINHLSVNSCLALVCDMDGAHVTTVEGISGSRDVLHPIQEAMNESHGSQCGYCTPGFIMSMYALWRHGKPVTNQKFEDDIAGNLCRCTGYRPIASAFEPFIDENHEPKKCCKLLAEGKCDEREIDIEETPTTAAECRSQHSQERHIQKPSKRSVDHADTIEERYARVFQRLPDSNLLRSLRVRGSLIAGKTVDYFAPRTLNEVCELRNKGPHRLQVGNTERRIEMFFKQNHTYPLSLISLSQVPELLGIEWKENSVIIGASESLTNVEEAFEAHQGKGKNILEPHAAMLRWFAGRQIRNVACIAANIVTASPISDLNPLHLVTGAIVNTATIKPPDTKITYRSFDLTNFFVGYRKVALEPNETIVSIEIPYAPDAHFQVYKQARRRDDDLAIVNAAYWVRMDGDKCIEARFAYGGMAPWALRVKELEELWIGKQLSIELLDQSMAVLDKKFNLPDDVPGGMPDFRKVLSKSFFLKYFTYLDAKINSTTKSLIPLRETSAALEHSTLNFHSEPKKGLQYFDRNYDLRTPLGAPSKHMAGHLHTTGKAQYCDDLPLSAKELFLDFVFSTKPRAKITSVDYSKCEDIQEFVCKLDHTDVAANKVGQVLRDEEFFAVNEVFTCGQIIACVVAKTRHAARLCAKAVQVTYEPLPHIVSLEEAIEKESFFDLGFLQNPGATNLQLWRESGGMEGKSMDEYFDWAKKQRGNLVVAEDEFFMGGQEHFFIETNAARTEPRDDDLYMTSSTQHPSENQMIAAEVLQEPLHKIHCKVVRLGGGFGGKESRSCILGAYTAVAARKLGVPVRFQMDRDVDMQLNGKRHAFAARYKIVASRETKKVIACDVQLYCNAGWSLDISHAVMQRACLHVENCCAIPNIRVRGYVCKTNIQSNTAFRGFGGPQALLTAEIMYQHAAELLGITREELVKSQLYRDHELTFYNHSLGVFPVERMWDQVERQADVAARRQAIAEFNAINRYKKRGLSIVPTKYGISFTATFLNQAYCLIHVHKDGTVLVSHGGCEMGQGLHTKIATVVAHEMNIPLSCVHIAETSTQHCANTSATAASSGSDINGNAALDACKKLNEHLKPYRKPMEDGQASLAEAAKAAYLARVPLSASGYYKTPITGVDWKKRGINEFKGEPFYYYGYGVGVSEVEIDCLTGDFEALRTDIVHDVGESLSPMIDIGQIEGAFMQGMGLYTIEEITYHKQAGNLLSLGPGLYKIPGLSSIPADFRVSLLQNSTGPTIMGSKAIGEPPLFLAASVYFAIKEAIRSAREDAAAAMGTGTREKSGYFRLDSPLTAERIRLACVDERCNPPGSAAPQPTFASRTHWHARA